MRSLPLFLVPLGLFLSGIAQQVDLLPLSTLLTEREYRKYQSKQKYKDRVDQFRKALDRHTTILESRVRHRHKEGIQESLRAIVDLSRHIRNEPTRSAEPKDLSSKQVRKLEIDVRKLLKSIQDMKFEFSIEVRKPFESAMIELKLLRDQLLAGIFGQAVRSSDNGDGSMDSGAAGILGFSFDPGFRSDLSAIDSFSGSTTVSREAVHTHQRRRGGNAPGDRFTEDEVDQIRFQQGLRKRVDVFLEIAESRLDEIERRLAGDGTAKGSENEESDVKTTSRKRDGDKKKDGKDGEEEENPLEFFTYWDMIHAYERAIDGITINIDDHARSGRTKEKDIRKTLETLNEKIQEFIPRLDPIEQLAMDQRDESLYREVRKAKKISDIALKGSQLGLGAPVK